MLYFQYDPRIEPDLRGRDVLGKAVMILRWAENPDMRMLMYGKINVPIQVRKQYLSGGRTVWEVSLQVANAWQNLSPKDEVFIYDPELLSPSERSELMRALSLMLTGESGVEENDIDEAVSSILSTYRS